MSIGSGKNRYGTPNGCKVVKSNRRRYWLVNDCLNGTHTEVAGYWESEEDAISLCKEVNRNSSVYNGVGFEPCDRGEDHPCLFGETIYPK